MIFFIKRKMVKLIILNSHFNKKEVYHIMFKIKNKILKVKFQHYKEKKAL